MLRSQDFQSYRLALSLSDWARRHTALQSVGRLSPRPMRLVRRRMAPFSQQLPAKLHRPAIPPVIDFRGPGLFLITEAERRRGRTCWPFDITRSRESRTIFSVSDTLRNKLAGDRTADLCRQLANRLYFFRNPFDWLRGQYLKSPPDSPVSKWLEVPRLRTRNLGSTLRGQLLAAPHNFDSENPRAALRDALTHYVRNGRFRGQGRTVQAQPCLELVSAVFARASRAGVVYGPRR